MSIERQISVYLSASMGNVGAATSRPRSKMLRIRIGFRRIRNMLPPWRPMGAPTITIGTIQ